VIGVESSVIQKEQAACEKKLQALKEQKERLTQEN
jgi:hypothetical protein